MKREFLASLALHLLGLYLLSLGTSGGSPPGGKSQEESKKEEDGVVDVTLGEILPKPQDKKEEVVKPDPEVSEDAILAATHNSQECPDFYGGIGVQYDFGSYTVDNVVAGYPAARAGIRAGDVVMQSPHVIRGPIGSTVIVPVMRGDKHLEFSMTREKICVSKSEKRRLDAIDKLLGDP